METVVLTLLKLGIEDLVHFDFMDPPGGLLLCIYVFVIIIDNIFSFLYIGVAVLLTTKCIIHFLG